MVFVGPLMFLGLIRLHRQYMVEDTQLEEGASEAAEAPVLTRHAVIVLVDRLDMATARALQYARTLHPDELRAIHFALDPLASHQLEDEWRRLGLSDFPLDIQECEDRRLTRAALELAAETVADRRTELTILLPRRIFASGWQRVLHDNTAETIATAVGHLEHVNATVVPYQLAGGWWSNRREWRRRNEEEGDAADPRPTGRRQGGRPRSGRPGPVPPGGLRGTGPGHHPDRRRPVASTGAGGRPGALGPGPAEGRARPTSSACWPTTAASCSWCSRGAAGSRASSPAPVWWSRGWSVTGPAARPSSIPTTSSSPAPRRPSRTHLIRAPGGPILAPDPRNHYVLPDCRKRRAPGAPRHSAARP